MKKIGMFLTILIILAVVFTLTKDMIAQTAIINGVKSMTGLEVQLSGVKVGIFKPYINLGNLKILNPSGFTDKIMADFPEIYAHYNLGNFLKGKIHFEELRINLKELNVVRNQQNVVNINSLKAFLPKSGGGKPPEIQIDALNLKIGKVAYKDQAIPSQNREFNINLDENFKDITDPKALSSLILVKALSKTTIPSLANINLNGLKDEISKAVNQQAVGILQNVKDKAAETLMKTEGGIQKLFQPKP